jgi:hypothetical protein
MFAYVHNADNNINSCQLVPEEGHYCVVLLQQYGLVLVNIYNLEFSILTSIIFNCNDASEGN